MMRFGCHAVLTADESEAFAQFQEKGLQPFGDRRFPNRIRGIVPGPAGSRNREHKGCLMRSIGQLTVCPSSARASTPALSRLLSGLGKKKRNPGPQDSRPYHRKVRLGFGDANLKKGAFYLCLTDQRRSSPSRNFRDLFSAPCAAPRKPGELAAILAPQATGGSATLAKSLCWEEARWRSA
jgi:hypothetical protein